MKINFKLNGKDTELVVIQDESLLSALRRAGIWSLKHGCETGECGACSVLMDGKIVPTCIQLAPQADGHEIETVEGLSEVNTIHPIQKAFTETGAIQCGFCTPAMVLSTKALLEQKDQLTIEDARDALSATICRCTGYVKPIDAVFRAAAVKRGEEVTPIDGGGIPMEIAFGLTGESDLGRDLPDFSRGGDGDGAEVQTRKEIKTAPWVTPESQTDVVGRPEIKVDAVKLVKGKPAFTDDINLPGMLYAELLTSPHTHARIRNIDTSKAKALQGVHAVLTYKDIPRVIYASGGQSWPNPKPWDQVSLDNKVRHFGDRVAVVAAETPQIAKEAIKLIEVDYELLPFVLDPREAGKPGAPVIHDEPDAVGITDASRNLVSVIDAQWNDVEAVLADSDRVFEHTYYTPKQQHVSIEPHITITYWDEDERLVVRTSTQVPFHTRRMLAPLIGLPVKRIRVIKPRIGGGFGGKQEMLIEDLAAHLTIATNRPVKLEYTREQEFTTARSRHPMYITYRVGVNNDGKLRAIDMKVISDTGAYGAHATTVASVSGLRGLSSYNADALRFHADIYYTNKSPAGAFRGYGGPQGMFGLEVIMDEIAHSLGFDPIEFRKKNAVQVGDQVPIATALSEGGPSEQYIMSSGLNECFDKGAQSIQWQRRNDPKWRVDTDNPHIRRGIGVAMCMHGTAIPGLDMGGATIKINDDGSFNVQVGATDLGTGSDTIIAQIVAETLGCRLEDIIIYSSDTDMTPFDVGAYASSTTFISGGSAKKAAEIVRRKIIDRAARMLETTTEGMYLRDRQAIAADGRSVTLEAVALNSLHTVDQEQIMGTASFMSSYSPPPFGAQFVEVEVDLETGMVKVPRMVMAVDCGTAINPVTAASQVEGGQLQALGMAISEAMEYDTEGHNLQLRLGDYRIYEADEAPEVTAILVPTYEPSGPYGAKAVAEIPMDGVAPAVVNAIFDAVGVHMRELPALPEKVWKAIQTRKI